MCEYELSCKHSETVAEEWRMFNRFIINPRCSVHYVHGYGIKDYFCFSFSWINVYLVVLLLNDIFDVEFLLLQRNDPIVVLSQHAL